MSQIQTKKLGRYQIIYNPELMSEPDASLFDCQQQENSGTLLGQAAGRGQTCFYRYGDTVWALRHYLRGGLIARFIKDSYLGLRLKQTRAWQEWHLLHEMVKRDLPVPVPVAARVRFNTFFYSADLITVFLENTTTLADFLECDIVSEQTWQSIGQCIRQFHDQQVYHSDLNARNILLDDNNKIYLIDFDRCGFRGGADWKQANLDRLKRSLLKFKTSKTTFNFDEKCWQLLQQGYQLKNS